MADFQEFPNNLTTLARRLRPLLFQLVGDVSGVGGLDWTKILLFDSGGNDPVEYPATSAGLDSALGDAGTDDIVLCPPGTISGNHTVSGGAELSGMGIWATRFSGTITVNSGSKLSNCLVTGSIATTSGLLFNVYWYPNYIIHGYDITESGCSDVLIYAYNISITDVVYGAMFGVSHEIDGPNSMWCFGDGVADSGGQNSGSILLNNTHFSNPGDTQVRTRHGHDSITSTAGGGWFTSDDMDIPVDSVWHGEIKIVMTEDGCANSYAYKVEFVAENDGGTTSILYSNVTTLYEDIATWDCQVVADDTNDRVAVQFRDTAETAIPGSVRVTLMWTISEVTNPA